MSNFTFLRAEWPAIQDAAARAEAAIHTDPRTACFYARRALEITVEWAYKSDPALILPYQDNLSALIHDPTFKKAAGEAVFTKCRLIVQIGNQAVHSPRPISTDDARTAVRELFHVGYWLARTYARAAKPAPTMAWDPALVPTGGPIPKKTLEQLQKLQATLREQDEKLTAVLRDKATLDEELQRLRAEVAAAKQANTTQPDAHDYSEAETRDFFIDLLLKESGWALSEKRDREFEVHGMPPDGKGTGYVDYVLWGDDGRPLALVEAKRTRKSPHVGQQQAKLYADCLEKQFGRRPVIFYSNGYEHWLWDDAHDPPRAVAGFLKKAELELLLQRRTSRKSLRDLPIQRAIAGRYYQERAIRRVAESFERDRERKALLVMATGAGKTRTVIALCDLLMRANWVKRVLFLADRLALVKQATNEFKKHLPDASPVNLVEDKTAEGRVYLSTYPTMMGLIDETAEGQRRFGPGHFDLLVIDEAHRSVYQKYRAIFDYFDSLLVGLTATPKDEIDVNTYGLFDLERGVPTDAYSLEEAVKDLYLVPPRAVSVPLRFQRQGIRYDELSEDEKTRWDALDWDEDGEAPEQVDANAVNKWLFNADTVDKVLEHLMTRGQRVAGGDRIGKTIIFAKNQPHAEFIAQRFDINYPQYQGQFARVVHCNLPYAQSLIDDFSIPGKPPHIAISVDMLDTGVDVPEVVNLVFFKLVRSKTKFWQMVGRGTRLCPELFGPDKDKEFFYIFDFCQNLEFFSQNPETSEGTLTDSLGAKIFKSRVELLAALDAKPAAMTPAPATRVAEPVSAYHSALRDDLATLLRAEVAAMNVNNFVVRPKRRLVEKFAKPEAWATLGPDARSELADELAGLPSELPADEEEAKRFDLLVLKLQLALLNHEPGFERLRDQVRAIGGLLEEKSSIPMVKAQLVLIQDVQSDAWWEDVNVAMLETARTSLRGLVKFIEKKARKPIYTDFEDTLGTEVAVPLPDVTAPDGFERFRAKARTFLRQHESHTAIAKLRMNKPLTVADLTEIERLLTEGGVGGPSDVQRAKEESHGLGLFVRSLLGLDRQAAKQAFGEFLATRPFTATQIEFVNMIVDHLTERGVMDAALLYESPFTDLTAQGPEGLFSTTEVTYLAAVLDQIRAAAVAA